MSVLNESETSVLIAAIRERKAVSQRLAENPHDKTAQRASYECEQAMAQLVAGHYGLIASLGYKAARGFATSGITPDDVRQAAVIGFLRGIERYEPDKGRLSTYIWFWIREAVWNACRDTMGFSGHWGNDLYWSLHSLVSSTEQSVSEMSHEDIAEMWNRSVIASKTAKTMKSKKLSFEDAYKVVLSDRSLKKTLLTPKRVGEILRAGETVDYLDTYSSIEGETIHKVEEPTSDSAEDEALRQITSTHIADTVSALLKTYATEHGQVVEFLRLLFGIDRDRMSITAAAREAGLSVYEATAEMTKFVAWARRQDAVIKLKSLPSTTPPSRMRSSRRDN